ncbi:Uncharacterized endonuclease [Gammaproteobacteria bacterium]
MATRIKLCRRYIFLLLLFTLPATVMGAGTASAYTAQVRQVIDGDTVELQSSWRQVRVRLAEIDAPEHDQPYGMAAREALVALVGGRMVRIVPIDRDRYGRVVARLYVGSLDVNAALVRRGYAWVYRQYAHDPALFAAEQEARSTRRGLWAQGKPMPPWEWRAQERGYFR